MDLVQRLAGLAPRKRAERITSQIGHETAPYSPASVLIGFVTTCRSPQILQLRVRCTRPRLFFLGATAVPIARSSKFKQLGELITAIGT